MYVSGLSPVSSEANTVACEALWETSPIRSLPESKKGFGVIKVHFLVFA